MCVCVCVFLKRKTGDEGGGVSFTSLEERNWEFSQSSREIGESWKVLKCHCGENSVQLQDLFSILHQKPGEFEGLWEQNVQTNTDFSGKPP